MFEEELHIELNRSIALLVHEVAPVAESNHIERHEQAMDALHNQLCKYGANKLRCVYTSLSIT